MKEIAKNLYAVTGSVLYSVPIFIIEVNENELIMIDTGLKKDVRTVIKKLKTKWGSLDKIKKIAVRIEYNVAPPNVLGPKYKGPIYIDNVVIK